MDHLPSHPNTERDAAVIRMRQDWAALRSAPPVAEVETHWHALRAGRLVPDRAEVDPRAIQSALRHAMIVERIAPGHARIRIAGNHVSDVMGMEVRGMPLSALFEPAARVDLQGALRELFSAPAIQKFALQSPGRLGRPALRGQLALYPLRCDHGEISRALGCIVTEGVIGRTPRRFDIAQVNRHLLQTQENGSLNRAYRSTFTEPAAAAAAEAGTPFENTAVPWLRVVSGGRN